MFNLLMKIVYTIYFVIKINGKWHAIQTFVTYTAAKTSRMICVSHRLKYLDSEKIIKIEPILHKISKFIRQFVLIDAMVFCFCYFIIINCNHKLTPMKRPVLKLTELNIFNREKGIPSEFNKI